MRNFKIAMTLTGIFLINFSCTELEDQSYDEIITSTLNLTSDDITSVIGAAYGNWRLLLLDWNGYHRSQEISADEYVIPARPNGWVDGGIYRRIHEHKWTADEDNVNKAWTEAYSGISSCNRVISQIESGELAMEYDAEKNSIIAELRVLRASYYYVLCDMYGNVPIETDYDVEEGYLPEQNTRKEVYDFIIKEITESLDFLKTNFDQSTYGRFNQWAARTLLAKMYLNAEVFSGTAHWEDCLEQCNAIINSDAGYLLEDDQKNVFVTENQNSEEIIFGIGIDENYTTEWNAFNFHMETLQPENQATYNLKETPWGGSCAIPQFIDTFDPEDSRLTQNFIYGQQYSSSGDSLFCTMGSIVGEPLAYINEVPGIDDSQEIHGYRFGKFEYAMGSSNILNNDYPLFRYADVLMMKAECLLRTGKADEAAAIVTQVRERSFKSNPAKAVVTGSELMQGSVYDYGLRNHIASSEEGGEDIAYGRFLDELGWEFNQEGRRRQDLIRFGVFTKKSWLSHAPNGENKALFPISTKALESNSNLTQNQGY